MTRLVSDIDPQRANFPLIVSENLSQYMCLAPIEDLHSLCGESWTRRCTCV